MNDEERYKALLAQLGRSQQVAADGSRRLAKGEASDGLAAILREIDETVLGRELTFRNDRGEEICLEVSGRRLRRVKAVSPEGLADGAAELRGHRFTDASSDELDMLAGLLAAITGDAGGISVTAARLADREAEAEMGITASRLAQEWSVDILAPKEPTSAPSLEQFLARSEGLFGAALHRVPEGEAFRAGDERMLEVLSRLAGCDDAVQDLLDGSSPQNTRGCVIMRGAGPTDEFVLLARDDDGILAMTVPPADLPRVMALWQGK